MFHIHTYYPQNNFITFQNLSFLSALKLEGMECNEMERNEI